MRPAPLDLVLVLALTGAACAPDIAPGAYLCGPDGECPEGQACNGPDAVCVLPSAALPFACGDDVREIEPNNDLLLAQSLGAFACVSNLVEVLGCVPEDDAEDWFTLSAPATCTAVAVHARIGFPIAFERVALQLRDEAGAILATGGPCAVSAADDGADQLCLTQPIAVGGTYAIRVAHAAEGDCDGACAHNRYALAVQLATP